MSEAETAADEADAPAEDNSAKLFGEWPVADLEYRDPSTERYINVTPIAHTMGRHADRQFQKSEISIVERLINRLMQEGHNTGKKHARRRSA